jgi:hypothetical protein
LQEKEGNEAIIITNVQILRQAQDRNIQKRSKTYKNYIQPFDKLREGYSKTV